MSLGTIFILRKSTEGWSASSENGNSSLRLHALKYANMKVGKKWFKKTQTCLRNK